MKSFTLIKGFSLLSGCLFFANPTNLLAIVGWLFCLVMPISGASSLMVSISNVITGTVPSSNYSRAPFRLFLVLFCYRHRHGTSGVAVTIIAWWPLSQPLPGLKLIVNVSLVFRQPALSIALICLVFGLSFAL